MRMCSASSRHASGSATIRRSVARTCQVALPCLLAPEASHCKQRRLPGPGPILAPSCLQDCLQAANGRPVRAVHMVPVVRSAADASVPAGHAGNGGHCSQASAEGAHAEPALRGGRAQAAAVAWAGRRCSWGPWCPGRAGRRGEWQCSGATLSRWGRLRDR